MPPRHAFPWPPIDLRTPDWMGNGFRIGNRLTPVLQYEAGPSGWSESLTSMHEEATNAGKHPIDLASRQHARTLVKRYLRTPAAEAVLLEAGCSSGYLLEELVADWPDSLVVGSDYIVGPLERLAKRMPQVPLLQFDLVKCPLPSSHVDAVVLLNVLEHIEDDVAAVAQVVRILKPGGLAVIEVPAGPRLYDGYDRHLKHCRRFACGTCAACCRRRGSRWSSGRISDSSCTRRLPRSSFTIAGSCPPRPPRPRNRPWCTISAAAARAKRAGCFGWPWPWSASWNPGCDILSASGAW
jgi:hypothetical protein